MNKKKQEINEYSLPTKQERHGVLVHPFGSKVEGAHNTLAPHRDDHYQLLFAFEGQYHFRIDFEEVILQAPFVLQLEPRQVHQLMQAEQAKGWAVGIEPSFLEEEFKHFLDDRKHQIIALQNNSFDFQQSAEIILEQAFGLQEKTHTIYMDRAIFHLLNSLLCLLINQVNGSPTDNPATKEKRAYIIAQEFRSLLKQHYKDWKRPSLYAQALSLTTTHLNDSIKEVSGKSVTSHLQAYNIMEAKRLLYFTDMEVKEIAFSIGYEDPVYFSRLFKKLTGMTPLDFRQQFRD